MKKRWISLLLALVLCFALIPADSAYAVQTDSNSIKVMAEEAGAEEIAYSLWAMDDLAVGDTYGIYPQSWYDKGMTVPIKNSQLRVLAAGLRGKLLDTGCATEAGKVKLNIKSKMTVEETLEVLYSVISGYGYKGSIGLEEGLSSVLYMAEHGIFTGAEGELSLGDVCTVEQACVIATRLVTYIYDALDAASKGFLWEVKSGQTTVYLLGSIHMATYDIYPFSEKMLEAFQSSDALAVELNMLDPNGTAILMQYGMYTDGTTLKDHVSAETYQKTVELGKKVGFSEIQIALFKPWVLDSLFSAFTSTNTGSLEGLSLATELGIDMKFTVDAILSGKPVLEVEGYELQAQTLDSFSDELEEYMLDSTIDTVNGIFAGTEPDTTDTLDEMLTYWHDGDVEAFKEYIAPMYNLPEFYEQGMPEETGVLVEEYINKLITLRDIGMASYIDTLLKGEGSRTYFVVLGSGHFLTDYSVIDLLMEKGYEITQIK